MLPARHEFGGRRAQTQLLGPHPRTFRAFARCFWALLTRGARWSPAPCCSSPSLYSSHLCTPFGNREVRVAVFCAEPCEFSRHRLRSAALCDFADNVVTGVSVGLAIVCIVYAVFAWSVCRRKDGERGNKTRDSSACNPVPLCCFKSPRDSPSTCSVASADAVNVDELHAIDPTQPATHAPLVPTTPPHVSTAEAVFASPSATPSPPHTDALSPAALSSVQVPATDKPAGGKSCWDYTAMCMKCCACCLSCTFILFCWIGGAVVLAGMTSWEIETDGYTFIGLRDAVKVSRVVFCWLVIIPACSGSFFPKR